MSKKNKALTALKRKKFNTGGSTGTSEKRTGPSNIVDLDNPNKDYFEGKGEESLQAPKADVKLAPAPGYDQAYITEGDEISTLKTGEDRTGVTVPTVDITSDLLSKDTFKIDSTADTAKLPLGFDAQNVARAFAEKTGFRYKIGSDGTIRYQDGQGNTFTSNPEDLAEQFELEGDFGTSLKASTYTAGEVKESDFVTATGAKRTTDPTTGLPIEPTKAEAGAATLTDAAVAAERDSFQETLAKGTAAQRPTEEPRTLNDKQAKLEYSQSEAGKAVYTAKAQAEQQYDNKEKSIKEQIRNADTPEKRTKLNSELLANSRNRSKMISDFQLAVKEGAALTKQNAASGIKQYAEGVTTAQTQEVADVAGPTVTTSEGVTISDDDIIKLKLEADKRGVGVEDLKEYQDLILTKDRTLKSGTAATRVDPVTGQPISQALDVTEEGLPAAEAATAEFIASAYTPDGGNTTIDNTPAYKKAASRQAQTGEAAARTAAELGNVPSEDFKGREAITGTAPQGDASQIGGVPTMAAASRNAVQGKERKVAAADMLAVVAGVPEEVTAAISEDPATVQAQIDEGADPQVTAAVAALPQEALVSVQMENLLAGMEDGETPAWARPAVAQVEQMMAQRGLSASTVGRDALFNAIIQSALPMAQSNAQALQQRAQQNLSNQQQANLGSAQNTMTVRMQNLANRQTAASQTASMAQEIRVQQGSFKQQATITTAQQEQQTEMATFQAAQQKSQQESAQRQQAAIAELNTNAQMDLANLQAMNAADSESMSAEQQARLTGYNAQIAKVMRQADLRQDMEKANLNASLQLELSNLSEKNAAAKDTMTAENQEKLTNLQTLVEFRKGDAQFAQQMDMANMSNEQQMELAMLQDKAATDAANFTADNQFELTRLNNVVARSVRQAELNQRMEEVNLDAELKIELSELTEANATSRANMSADQQTRLTNLNVLVDFKKTNAAMAQQMDLANLGNEQQMELANLAEKAATDSANMTAENRLRSQKLNNYVQVMSQDEQLKQQADLANLSMEEKISLANLSNQQQSDMASMSAENIAELQRYEKQMGAAQLNANLAQQMGLANLSNQQQSAMFNAQIDANLDMKQFDANQQMALANSQFMQSMTIKNLDNKQQAAMQNATAMASMDLQSADAATKVSIENARNFLAMDMAELNNDQQAAMLNAQQAQQTLLTNASAVNASKQFNATSENQTNQYMANLGSQMAQFNTAQSNAMKQFNVAEKNRLLAVNAGNQLEADKFSAQIKLQAEQFNATQDYNAEQWNAANAQAVEQSNVTWRRSSNTAETAATNAANQQSAGFQFNMDMATQSQMWQELRDTASYNRQAYENERNRLVGVVSSALSNEAFMTDDSFSTQRAALFEMLEGVAESVDSTKSGDVQGEIDDSFTDENGNRYNTDTDGDGIPDTYIPPNFG